MHGGCGDSRAFRANRPYAIMPNQDNNVGMIASFDTIVLTCITGSRDFLAL